MDDKEQERHDKTIGHKYSRSRITSTLWDGHDIYFIHQGVMTHSLI